ncbi:MAG: universal stress protein [Magnetococcales bacterium]|nr:universal stress protein [Magnetococcales bacterium]
MTNKRRIIAVIDLFSDPEMVSVEAMTLSNQLSCEMRFVTLFDHLNTTPSGLSSQEQFQHCENELMDRLRRHVKLMGAKEALCSVLSGHASEELGKLATQWGADLILADAATARTIHQGWFPWLHPITPLPCRLHVVPPAPVNFLHTITNFLQFPKPKDC